MHNNPDNTALNVDLEFIFSTISSRRRSFFQAYPGLNLKGYLVKY